MVTMRRSRGLSLVELVIAALVLGVSGVVVLELIRSSTVHLQLTEAEVAARGFAADVMERYGGPPHFVAQAASKTTTGLFKAEVGWDDLLSNDPWLREGFPREAVAPLLDKALVRLQMKREPAPPHPALGTPEGLILVTVTVSWIDHDDRRREVSLARYVPR
jgi:hypothetical protein